MQWLMDFDIITFMYILMALCCLVSCVTFFIKYCMVIKELSPDMRKQLILLLCGIVIAVLLLGMMIGNVMGILSSV